MRNPAGNQQDDLLLELAEHTTGPDGVLIVDAEGRMVSYNKRFVAMWGLSRAVARSGSDDSALRVVVERLVDPQGFLARVQYLYAHRTENSRDEIALKDDRIFERHSSPINDLRGRYLGRIWRFRDITERKRADNIRRETERMREHRDYIANVSHELRTPLAAIEGFVETLLNGGIRDRRRRMDFLRTIARHSRRLRHLVDSLIEISHLDVSRGKAPVSTVELKPYLENLARELRPLLRKKRASLRLAVPSGAAVAIDEIHLSRIVANVVDNAIKFSRSGGIVRVEAKAVGRRIAVAVTDRGVGIAHDDLPRVFERFRRSSTARRHDIKGSGIGLFLVKQLVEENGGTIDVSSREGKGTVVRFTLPRAKADRGPRSPLDKTGAYRYKAS
ncbi:MAG: sensor histidine kinase [Elusimicrobiota bacterium]